MPVSVPTVASLKRQRVRLDRQRLSADRMIAAMRNGNQTLNVSHEKSGDVWWLGDSSRVSPETAKLVIKSANIVSVGSLFPNVPGQTFRYVE